VVAEEVLGIKEREINEAIKIIKKQEVESRGNINIISEETVLKGLREVFEDMKVDSVPVWLRSESVTIDWLEKYCKKKSYIDDCTPAIGVNGLLKAVRLKAKEAKKK